MTPARIRSVAVGIAVAALAIGTASAQGGRWRQIGMTSTGNPVFLDPRSVSRDSAGIITATLRSTYTKPVSTPRGPITATRATAMFDCAAKKVAVKETIIYHDEAKGTVYERRAPRTPGFGPVFTSNFSGVALQHLCAPPASSPPPATSPSKAPSKAPASVR
jgi:hypothetical protein